MRKARPSTIYCATEGISGFLFTSWDGVPRYLILDGELGLPTADPRDVLEGTILLLRCRPAWSPHT